MAGYVVTPVVRNSVDAEAQMVETIQRYFPAFQPRDADAATILLRAAAVLYTDTAELVTQMGEEAFRFFGRSLAQILPIDEQAATGTVTITLIDDAGYTIPGGLQLSGRNGSGDTVAFQTITPTIVAPGDDSATVVVEALVPGTAGNGVQSEAAFEDYLDFLDTVTFTVATAGGTDAEDDDVYLDRLTEELQLQSPTPILPGEFAVLARRVDGVAMATALDNYDPGRNQITSIASSPGGSFTIQAGGYGTTASISVASATATAVKAALDALAGLEPEDTIVTGGPMGNPGTPIRIEWAGKFARAALAVTVTGTGTSGLATTTPQAATAPDPNTDRSVTIGVRNELGLPVGPAVRQAVADYLDSLRELNFQVFVIDPTYTAVDVSYVIVPQPGWSSADALASADAAIEQYLDPATWGLRSPVSDDNAVWLNDSNVRYFDLAAAIGAADGVRWLTALHIEGSDEDLPLTGSIPMPTAGTISGEVE